MMHTLREAVTQTISYVEINLSPEVLAAMQKQQQLQAELQQKKLRETRNDPAFASEQEPKKEGSVAQFRKTQFDQSNPESWADTPRNSPCPCGSGKKYKHCHGAVSGIA